MLYRFVRERAFPLQVKNGDTVFDDHMFETVGLQTREDWKGTGKKTLAFVRFNFLITRGIETKTFRQINYEKSISSKSLRSISEVVFSFLLLKVHLKTRFAFWLFRRSKRPKSLIFRAK